jgi:hypothetical protein
MAVDAPGRTGPARVGATGELLEARGEAVGPRGRELREVQVAGLGLLNAHVVPFG